MVISWSLGGECARLTRNLDLSVYVMMINDGVLI